MIFLIICLIVLIFLAQALLNRFRRSWAASAVSWMVGHAPRFWIWGLILSSLVLTLFWQAARLSEVDALAKVTSLRADLETKNKELTGKDAGFQELLDETIDHLQLQEVAKLSIEKETLQQKVQELEGKVTTLGEIAAGAQADLRARESRELKTLRQGAEKAADAAAEALAAKTKAETGKAEAEKLAEQYRWAMNEAETQAATMAIHRDTSIGKPFDARIVVAGVSPINLSLRLKRCGDDRFTEYPLIVTDGSPHRNRLIKGLMTGHFSYQVWGRPKGSREEVMYFSREFLCLGKSTEATLVNIDGRSTFDIKEKEGEFTIAIMGPEWRMIHPHPKKR